MQLVTEIEIYKMSMSKIPQTADLYYLPSLHMSLSKKEKKEKKSIFCCVYNNPLFATLLISDVSKSGTPLKYLLTCRICHVTKF